MSIPFFFFPVTVDGRRVYDGGLRNNFPLTRFLAQEPRSNFIALYLGKPDNINRRGLIGLDLLNVAIEGEERQTVDAHRDKVIVIDTSPVGTIDFKLSPLEKQFLLRAGKAAALKFLHARNFDDGPGEAEVSLAQSEAEASRQAVIEMRSQRSKLRLFAFFFLLLVVFGFCAYLVVR
jgi:predicted acylesterase/phospholipase RssA